MFLRELGLEISAIHLPCKVTGAQRRKLTHFCREQQHNGSRVTGCHTKNTIVSSCKTEKEKRKKHRYQVQYPTLCQYAAHEGQDLILDLGGFLLPNQYVPNDLGKLSPYQPPAAV